MATPGDLLLTSLFTLLVATAFVHVAAKILVKRATILKSIIGVLVGSVLAGLVQLGAEAAGWKPWIIVVLALGAFSLTLALVYRTKWVKGAIIGVVAWIMWVMVRFAIDAIVR